MSDLKIEGLAKDWCAVCANCTGKKRLDGHMYYICEDPYDGFMKEIDADSDVCCSMFEPEPDMYDPRVRKKESCDTKTARETELEARIDELIKASRRKDELIQDYRDKLKKANILGDSWKSDLNYWREGCHKAETDVTTLNSKVEVLKNKSDKYLNKIINQQTTHYKQCARILELETMVNKLQSGEYDDILAKDIEIKSLQAKYDDAMAGWKDSIDTNDRQIEEFTRKYNKIAKKLNDIHDILKEENEDE